jgi:hypothetical protein
MIRIEGSEGITEKCHFFHHLKNFKVQVSLLQGKVSVNGNDGATLLDNNSPPLFIL